MLTSDERARALRFLHAHAPPGALLQCGVTGAHAYGFLSPDSDVDLKGLHLTPTEQVLGLDAPRETHDVLVDFEGVEHDLTTHEAGKALGLLARGNGNVLERLLSPLQLVESTSTPCASSRVGPRARASSRTTAASSAACSASTRAPRR